MPFYPITWSRKWQATPSILAWKTPWTEREAWWATVPGITNSQTQLSD